MTNSTIAKQLLDHAHHLEERHRNLYRIRAYRRAAETILGLDQPLAEIAAEGGLERLRELPGIGRSLSTKLLKLLATGDLETLSGRVQGGQPALGFHAELSDADALGS